MSDTPELADKNVEIWKVKKLIKSLEAARGNGTSMISLIIPPGITEHLSEEYISRKNSILQVIKFLESQRCWLTSTAPPRTSSRGWTGCPCWGPSPRSSRGWNSTAKFKLMAWWVERNLRGNELTCFIPPGYLLRYYCHRRREGKES